MKKIMLVYQVGIANLFEVEDFTLSREGRAAKRLLQAGFRKAENVARVMKLAGCQIQVAHCNMPSDVSYWDWSDNLEEAPFFSDMKFKHLL